MKIKLILYFLTFGLFINCKKENIEKSKIEPAENISATNNYDLIGSHNFKFYADSTYVFTIVEKSTDYEKIEKFSGLCYLKNDTLYFKPFNFKFNKSEKAIIKNNFIEFINPDFPLKIEIKKNIFQTKSKLDLKKYSDYAFFTFDAKFHGSQFDYQPSITKPYDINQNELVEIDQILKKCFSENTSKLRNTNKYIKQCIATINNKKEKEVWIRCYCRNSFVDNEYKYSLIKMNDGGNCNISLKINLTKHEYSDLNISGSG